MKPQIIYQVSEQEPGQLPKQTRLNRLCNCLSMLLIREKKQLQNYQIEIESPKVKTLMPNNSQQIGNKKLLVLDLDETLVHSTFKDNGTADFTVKIEVQGLQIQVYVVIRPGALSFIERLSEYYHIVFFTASMQEYADPVMNYIDPGNKAIMRYFRNSCSLINGCLIKNLNVLEHDLSQVVIIDNSALSYSLQPENGILIRDFFFDKNDQELEKLVPFLIWLSKEKDVRPTNVMKTKFEQGGRTQGNSKTNMEEQYLQYEQQQLQSSKERTSRQSRNSSFLLPQRGSCINTPNNQEVVAINQKPQSNISTIKSKTMSIKLNQDYMLDSQELRVAVNLNSPSFIQSKHPEVERNFEKYSTAEYKEEELQSVQESYIQDSQLESPRETDKPL